MKFNQPPIPPPPPNLVLFEQFRSHFENSKYMPLDLRPRKTRAIRRRLTADQVRGEAFSLRCRS